MNPNPKRVTDPLFYVTGSPKFAIDEASGCWLWTAALSDAGYGIACLPDGRREQAHITHWKLKRGPVPEGKELDHKCRVRNCINLDHLEPVTRTINVRRGLAAKIDENTALVIRLAYKSGNITHTALAEIFGLHRAHVCRIANGKLWR